MFTNTKEKRPRKVPMKKLKCSLEVKISQYQNVKILPDLTTTGFETQRKCLAIYLNNFYIACGPKALTESCEAIKF